MKANKYAHSITFVIAVVVAVTLGASVAVAATVEGSITDTDGNAVPGALVTLFSIDGLFSETTYAKNDGFFRIKTKQQGRLNLRARVPLHKDSFVEVNLEPEGILNESLILTKLTSLQEISDTFSAGTHLAQLKFDTPQERQAFTLNCIGCHLMGDELTRRKRSKSEWFAVVGRMLDRINVNDPKVTARYVTLLSSAFDGKPIKAAQPQAMAPEVLNTQIREWKLPEAVVAHDMIAHSNGKYYTIDMGTDRIYVTDPETNLTETIEIPHGGIELGGKIQYSSAANRADFALSLRHGPHSLQEGPDGRIYTTDVVSTQIGVFDPKTNAFSGYDVGNEAIYPHTLRFDREGTLWFTIGMSNQVGRLDPVTGKMTVINLPANDITYPYGIDINPVDNSAWYTQFTANKVGRIDAVTLKVEEFEVPFSGPRRMRFADDGTLWIAGFSSGVLAKLDTGTMRFTEYVIPMSGVNEQEAPYAVYVHPTTQEVWVTSNLSDRLYRFIPDEGRFLMYPLPTRGSYMRDLDLDDDGNLCGTVSSIPATTTEGKMQFIVCLNPHDDREDFE